MERGTPGLQRGSVARDGCDAGDACERSSELTTGAHARLAIIERGTTKKQAAAATPPCRRRRCLAWLFLCASPRAPPRCIAWL